MSEGKNIPRLRFPEFEDDWFETKTKNIAPLQRGFDLPTVEIEGGNYPVVYSNGVLRYHNEFKVNGPGVVTGRSGTIGKVTYINENFWPHNTSLWVTNFNNNYPRFIYYFYLNFKLDRYNAGSTVPTLNRNDVHFVKKRIPSLPEQQKIADFLTEVDKRIELLEKKKTLLETYKKGVMKKIFNQEIRFKDNNGNDFPDWEETTLGKLAKITTGDSNRSDSESFGDYMFFDRSVDVRMSSTYSFDTEAIIVAGEGKDFIPRYYNGKFGLHQRTYAIYDFINSDAKFLYYWIYYLRYFFLKTSVGSTMPSLRMNSFSKFPVSKPTKEEQVKISKFLSSIDNQIELLENQIDKSKTWKKGLLQKMFV